MYIDGREPRHVRPRRANHARAALAALDHLVVQDIFLTETACLADVVLPASAFAEKTGSFTNTDRLVQLGRQAIARRVRRDRTCGSWWQLASAWAGLALLANLRCVAEVFDEMRHTMPSIAGITWDRLQAEGAVTYPCRHEGDAGEPVVFVDHFPRPVGARALCRPTSSRPTNARRRLPDGADHRPAAGALAHRQHDAARRARWTRSSPIRWRWCTRWTWPRWGPTRAVW
jgi:formate dehydrogenase major subunit